MAAALCRPCQGRGSFLVQRTIAVPAHAGGCQGDCENWGCPVPEPQLEEELEPCPACEGFKFESMRFCFEHDSTVLGDTPHCDRQMFMMALGESLPECEIQRTVVPDRLYCPAGCGDLYWTIEEYGHITHKEACEYRNERGERAYQS